MNLLITGGTGFFGRALLRMLAAQWQGGRHDFAVTVMTRSPAAFTDRYPSLATFPWLSWHQGDILAPESLPEGQRFTHILHAAADSTLGPGLAPLQRYDQIVNGTRHLLDFAVRCGAEGFLLTSSGAVYGQAPAGMERIAEDWHGIPDPLVPASAYGMGKRVAEHLCALYGQAHDLRTVVARCFAFAGEDLPLDVHFAIGNFVRDALMRPEIIVGGDGTPMRSYLHQQDLAHWLLQLLEHGTGNRAYNVGSDQAISVADLAHRVRDLLAPGKPVRVMGQAVSGADRHYYVPDISRIRREMGLDISISLDEAILDMARAAQKQLDI